MKIENHGRCLPKGFFILRESIALKGSNSRTGWKLPGYEILSTDFSGVQFIKPGTSSGQTQVGSFEIPNMRNFSQRRTFGREPGSEISSVSRGSDSNRDLRSGRIKIPFEVRERSRSHRN
jgi:hypothetical protein